MITRTRLIGSTVAALAVAASALAFTPAAQATESEQMNAAALNAAPVVQQWNQYTRGVLTGPFHADGIARRLDGTAYNYESFLSDGKVLREQYGEDPGGMLSEVIMFNGKDTCVRKGKSYMKAQSADISADARSTWKCGHGRDKKSFEEIDMLVPGGAATLLGGNAAGVTFTYEETLPGTPNASLTLRAYVNGTPAAQITYFKEADGYQYSMNAQKFNVNYGVHTGMDGKKIVPFNKLHKTWGLKGLVAA